MGALELQFTQAISKRNYPQGINAVPLFLVLAAYSGMEMKKEYGVGYSQFWFSFKNDYGEMNYNLDDFPRIWKAVGSEVRNNKKYLPTLKRKYEKTFQKYLTIYKNMGGTDLRKLNNKEIVELFHHCRRGMTDSVGIAHIIETVGQMAEPELKSALTAKVSDPKLRNVYFTVLVTPSQPSFLKQEEDKLLKLKGLSGKKLEQALQKHAEEYFWLQNTYLGESNLNARYFENRLRELVRHRPKSNPGPKPVLNAHILNNPAIKNLSRIIDFTTVWQDERKINILVAISFLDRIIKEISRRTNIPRETLIYISCSESFSVKQLEDVKKLEPVLKQRKTGGLYLLRQDGDIIAAGPLYKKLTLLAQKQHAAPEEIKELRGSSANTGSATGKVVICTDMKSISKVRHGDVLVSSMTRPEYMPALKKAAAIVTDEGGITSHAAIVARELNIPCVIGTKTATKILKDGQMVEVRANHGIVKII